MKTRITPVLDMQSVLQYFHYVPQFLIPPASLGQLVSLSPGESRHLRDVLRMAVGDKVRLSDGAGHSFRGEIREITKKGARVLLVDRLPETRKGASLKIAQSLLKGDKMEFVIQKAVELGADSFHPFVSSRSIAKFEKKRKLTRWQKIADEAVKQSGRAARMTIEEPDGFDKILFVPVDLKIIFWEEEGESVREFFRRNVRPSSLLALIGPEGGFSKQEVEKAQKAGFTALSMGPRILRAETAAIVAMSLIQYELGNF